MKKIIALTTIIVLTSSSLFSQKSRFFASTICINAGYSLIESDLKNNDPETFSPAIGITYDFSPIRFLSIGIAASHQRISVKSTEINNYGYFNYDYYYNYNTDPLSNYDFKTIYKRTNIACRVLFNYGAQKVRMYSGFRIGATIMKNTTIGVAPEYYSPSSFSNDDFFNIIPLQVIPFGIRVYILDNIGFNAEIGLGSPHFFSAGLCFRI